MHVNPDTSDNLHHAVLKLALNFNKYSTQFPVTVEQVIGPFEADILRPKGRQCTANRHPQNKTHAVEGGKSTLNTQVQTQVQVFALRVDPLTSSAATARGLAVRNHHRHALHSGGQPSCHFRVG